MAFGAIITQANVDVAPSRNMASPGHNELAYDKMVIQYPNNHYTCVLTDQLCTEKFVLWLSQAI